jgi:hypothetical protein
VLALSATWARSTHRRPNIYAKPGINMDREVIQPENQTQTTITPLIDRLSAAFFRDYPYILKYKNNVEEKVSANQLHDDRALLTELLNKYARGPARIKIDKRNKLERSPQYLRQAEVGGEVFKVGGLSNYSFLFISVNVPRSEMSRSFLWTCWRIR